MYLWLCKLPHTMNLQILCYGELDHYFFLNLFLNVFVKSQKVYGNETLNPKLDDDERFGDQIPMELIEQNSKSLPTRILVLISFKHSLKRFEASNKLVSIFKFCNLIFCVITFFLLKSCGQNPFFHLSKIAKCFTLLMIYSISNFPYCLATMQLLSIIALLECF